MDAQLLGPNDLIRPWRRATIIASLVAAVELVLLIGASAVLLAKPLSHVISRHAAVVAAKSPAKASKQTTPAAARRAAPAPLAKARPRAKLRIMVFNGNGLTGAAAGEASRLQQLGYRVSGTGNARRQDYATSVIMYKPGYRAEGLRLARDLKVQVVGPLDGLHVSALDGGQLAVILGA